MDFPQAIDFGDGTTYTLPLSNNRDDAKQPSPRELQNLQEQHVSKADRFATDDFDRSWPPKASQVSGNQEGRLFSEQRPNDHPPVTRTLYNARSNKMEPSSERAAPSSIEQSRPQILPRSTKDNVAAAKPGDVTPDKSSAQHTLERQPSRERPWGRIPQPSALSADRNPWGRRRPSETEHSRTWGPPHLQSDHQAWPRATAGPHRLSVSGEGERMRSPPDDQSRLPPLFSQTQQTSAILSPPLVHPEPIRQAIDITELQKDEMHRAAEQARLRRQQEEAEREAQKERARQKAKEIAEREAQKLQALAATQSSPATASGTTRESKEDDNAPKPGLEENSLQNDAPRPATRPRPSQIMRRTSEKRVAFGEVVSISQNPGSDSLPRGSSAIPGPMSPDVALSASGDRAVAETARPNMTSPKSAADHVSPDNNRFSRFFDPLVESSHLSPTEIHYNDLSSLSTETAKVEPIQQAKSILPAASEKYNLQPELLQAESWRKSTRGQEVIVPGVIGSSRESRAPQRSLLSKPVLSAVPDTLQTVEELVMSPPAEVRVSLPLPLETAAQSSDDHVGSAFDTVLARLQSAMSSPNDHYHPRVDADGYRSSNGELQSPPAADDRQTEPVSESRLYFSVLPRPPDFVISTMPLPPSPAPAWKRYTIRLPREPAVIKPYARRRTRLAIFTPQGWALSWDPPLEQLGGRSASREDWLIPKTYHKGKLVAAVKLPTGRFQPYVPPPEEKRPAETSSITSQAIKEEGHKAGPRKIIVKLPTGNFRRREEVDDSLVSQLIREEFQTSSEIPSLSPSSSTGDLPGSRGMATEAPDFAFARKATRRTSQGPAIAFARPHGESFSDDADAKSSVRFMVSSEIEDDNLLSEVNKMSMDGLTDNPAAEETHRPGREAEPRVCAC